MPAVSKAQQRFFGMVHAGKIPKPKGMKKKDVKKFAKTKHKDLPEKKVSENEKVTFIQFLLESS